MKEKVVGLGEILWDIFPGGKLLGGALSNFAYHASQFGFEGYVVSAVGEDQLGREIIDTLAEKHIGHLIETVEYPTGTVHVTLDGNGIPQYDICENVAWDNIPFTERTRLLAGECRAVCFGTLAQRSQVSRSTIQSFMDGLPQGSLRVFDINLRQRYYDREIIEKSLSRCNILKINDEEVAAVAGLFGMEGLSEKEVCRRLMGEYHLDIVVETRGAGGSYVFASEETSYLDTPRIEVVDTVGAGDSFTGSFIAALLQGKPLRTAHRLAVDVSAYVCTQQGATPILPASYTNDSFPKADIS